MTNNVNHPKHYNNHPSGVECIDIIEHMNFNRGNAIKYIWRAGEKTCELEDIKKARWYLDREIARMSTEFSTANAEVEYPGMTSEQIQDYVKSTTK